jgi:hypothetical protein
MRSLHLNSLYQARLFIDVYIQSKITITGMKADRLGMMLLNDRLLPFL